MPHTHRTSVPAPPHGEVSAYWRGFRAALEFVAQDGDTSGALAVLVAGEAAARGDEVSVRLGVEADGRIVARVDARHNE